MKRSAVLLAMAMGLSSINGFAGTMGSVVPEKTWTWVSTISAGPLWSTGDKSQTFYLGPQNEKTYASRGSSEALVDGEFFFGVQKRLSYKWQGQLGISLIATGDAVFKGNIWDDADVAFNNYRYEYKVQHHGVLLKGKLLLDQVGQSKQFLPWISIGLGVGFNRAYDYVNTPLIFEAVRNNNFAKQVTDTFSYTLGLGAQKVFTEHWHAGVGYEFSDWGRSELGRAAGQTLNTGLKIAHIYTNGFLFNVTYVV